MITELASQEKVIGVKQSRKAIREGRARQVFLACDADPAITGPVASSGYSRTRRVYHGTAGAGLPHCGGRVRGGGSLTFSDQSCNYLVFSE